jgi:hypothetical protein
MRFRPQRLALVASAKVTVTTNAPSQPVKLEPGGHLGNLSQPAVPLAILRALDGSAESPENPKMRAIVEAKEAPATEFRAKGRSQICVWGGK